MATQKLGLLPWIKNAVDKRGSASGRGQRRPQFTPVQQEVFVQSLRLERRRSERSGKPFMLVLVGGEELAADRRGRLGHDVAVALATGTRETDILGWYEPGRTLGLLMTEIGRAEAADIATIIKKITTAVQQATTPEIYRRLTMTFKVFPEEVTGTSGEGADELLFPDVSTRLGRRRYEVLLKRSMDIAGSLFAIMMFLPAALIIAALVKFTSEGPVLFSQKRMGQYGREFNFLKFRTMYINNDPAVHREYVKKLIAGEGGVGQPNGMYKLANDKRITPLGRILRKTSLDELPQMINVLRNDMSLVGPRPPLPYEYERYQTWHKRRVRELKPGITGLWQVGGRSRINFEDMVRLDLRYANIRSIRLDIVILLRTPWAMISGRGAC